MAQKLPIAIVQQPPVFLNLSASVALAKTIIAEAARGGAKLVAFSETWLPGYPVWLDNAPGAALWGSRDLLFAEIDLALCNHGILYLDTHGHYSRPDVFELHVNTRSNPGVRFSDLPDQ